MCCLEFVLDQGEILKSDFSIICRRLDTARTHKSFEGTFRVYFSLHSKINIKVWRVVYRKYTVTITSLRFKLSTMDYMSDVLTRCDGTSNLIVAFTPQAVYGEASRRKHNSHHTTTVQKVDARETATDTLQP